MQRSVAVCAVALTVWAGRAEAHSIVVVAPAGSDVREVNRAGSLVTEVLVDRGHDVVGPGEAAREIETRQPGCMAERRPSCWATAAAQMGRDTVVSGRLERDGPSGEVTVTLEAIDVATVRVVAEAAHRTVAAEAEDLDALVRVVAGQLADRLPALRRTARLSVGCSPPGATVSVNGRLVGVAPWRGDVPEGPALVLIELPNHGSETRQLRLVAGEEQRIEVVLGAASRETRRVGHRLDALDAVLLSAGGLALLGGGAVVAVSLAPGETCAEGAERGVLGECARIERPGNLLPVGAVMAGGLALGAIVLIRLLVGDRVPVSTTTGHDLALTARF